MNELPTTDLNLLPLDTIVGLGLYFSLGAYVIFTAILYYHWQNYSSDSRVTGLTLGVYFATTLPLLLVMTIIRFIV